MIDGYFEVNEIAQEWGVSVRSVQVMCSNGRIPGAVKKGRAWCIPIDAVRPQDERMGAGDHRDKRLKARGEIPQSARENVRFMVNMSHDVRSSLSGILGFSDVMKKHLDDPARLSECIENIQMSGRHILDLMNNVLEYTRLNNGMATLNEEVSNAEEVLDEVVHSFDDEAFKKGISIHVSRELLHEFVYMDRELHSQVLFNVIGNAIKYTRKDGQITIKVCEKESKVVGNCLHQYEITDTGIGMAETFVEHIYDSFSREQNSEIEADGCGLGMSIVKKLLSLMKGNIRVRSLQGNGTTVIFTIPHKIADLSECRKDENVQADLEFLKGKRILLAEDNDLNREVAEEILKDVGFQVESVRDGILCVAMIEMKPADYYDCILMDIMMPHMDGIKATEVIRSLGDRQKAGIPIIAMTANVTPEEKERALAAGMNGFTGKPIGLTALINVIQTALNQRPE